MDVKGIYLNWIVVSDINASIKFYTEVVGLTLKNFDEKYNWAELAGPDGSFLGIAEENLEQQLKAGVNAIITVTVGNIADAVNEFTKKGVRLLGSIMEVPGHVKLQSFVDQDGNMLQLVEKLQ